MGPVRTVSERNVSTVSRHQFAPDHAGVPEQYRRFPSCRRHESDARQESSVLPSLPQSSRRSVRPQASSSLRLKECSARHPTAATPVGVLFRTSTQSEAQSRMKRDLSDHTARTALTTQRKKHVRFSKDSLS